jgi:hypothetical protein
MARSFTRRSALTVIAGARTSGEDMQSLWKSIDATPAVSPLKPRAPVHRKPLLSTLPAVS